MRELYLQQLVWMHLSNQLLPYRGKQLTRTDEEKLVSNTVMELDHALCIFYSRYLLEKMVANLDSSRETITKLSTSSVVEPNTSSSTS